MKILAIGESVYIVSHIVCELLNDEYEVVIVDNLCRSIRQT